MCLLTRQRDKKADWSFLLPTKVESRDFTLPISCKEMGKEFQLSTSCRELENREVFLSHSYKEMNRGTSPFNILKGHYFTSYKEYTAMTPSARPPTTILQPQWDAWQPAGLRSQQAQRTLIFCYKHWCLSLRPGVLSRPNKNTYHQILFFLINISEQPPWNLLHNMDLYFTPPGPLQYKRCLGKRLTPRKDE